MNEQAKSVLSNMLFRLATGWYPWGFKPHDVQAVCLCEDRWIMCCGNWLTKAEGEEAFARGLVGAGDPDRFGRPTMAITAAGEEWLAHNWPRWPAVTGREE